MEMKNYDDEAAVRFLRNGLDSTYKRKNVVTRGYFGNLTKIAKRIIRLSGRPVLIGYSSFNHAGLFYEVKPVYLWVAEKLFLEAPKQMDDDYNWHVEMDVNIYTSAFPLSQFPKVAEEIPHSIFTGERGIFIQVYYYEPVDYLENGIIFFNEKLLEVQTGQYLLDRCGQVKLYPRKSNDIKKYFLEQEEIEGFEKFLLYFLKKSEKMIQCKI